MTTGIRLAGMAPAAMIDAVPRRREVIGDVNDGANALANRLELDVPEDLTTVPPTLAFNRVREVALPWVELIEQMSAPGGAATGAGGAMRSYFERSWWGEDRAEPTAEDIAALIADGLIWVLPVPDEQSDAVPAFHTYTEVTEEKDGKTTVKPSAAPLTAGLVLRHGISGRYYLVTDSYPEREADTPHPITTPDGYVTFWAAHFIGVEVVFTSPAEAAGNQTRFEYLDMRATFIERRFQELKILEDVSNKTSTRASKAMDALIEAPEVELDFTAIEEVQSQFVEARLGPYRIQRQLRQLQRMAADMGYVLFLGGEKGQELEFPDGSKKTAAPGTLYATYKRQCAYTVSHKKSVVQVVGNAISWAFSRVFGGKTKKVTTTYTETRSKVVKDYREVDTLTDPLSQSAGRYRDAGNEVFVFNETPSGYQTNDGITLPTVMARCQDDEAFRRNCVVFLPVYEQSFSVQRPIVGYNIFERPLPGIMPSRLPRLFMDESLSYRTAWQRSELGELVRAINLGPGEEREIAITSSYQEETTTTDARTSIVELSSAESTDIATEMERIARTENELNTHVGSSSEASVGGPLGGAVTGSFSSRLDYGASDSLKTFNQSMNKVAKKAASSISRKSQQEISTSSTRTTTISKTDTTTIKLSNINEGRTLNLMFYRVYNRYQAGLFLEDLKFGVTSAVELIAGSGVYETRSFPPEQLGAMLEMLRRTPLPLETTDEAVTLYQHAIIDAMLAHLGAEYLAEGDDDDKEDDETMGGSVHALRGPLSLTQKIGETPLTTFRAPMTTGKRAAPRKKAATQPLEDRVDALIADFSKLSREVRPLGGVKAGDSDLVIASPGLYMDALVGSRPSTEPYAEELRAQEIRKRAAEVLKLEAEAQYSLAQAQRIGQMPTDGPAPANVLTGVHVHDSCKLLSLAFLLPLPSGKWEVHFDGKAVAGGAIPEDQLMRTSVVLSFPRRPRVAAPEWLQAPDLMTRVTVYNTETFETISPA
ncbi:hypothetical protein KHP62_00185 [Rhodobacteraceae bacterium NNCM2]|nr:hypothetical protein [Coraliihabitans acroporae]